jgi:hypothetical protein
MFLSDYRLKLSKPNNLFHSLVLAVGDKNAISGYVDNRLTVKGGRSERRRRI